MRPLGSSLRRLRQITEDWKRPKGERFAGEQIGEVNKMEYLIAFSVVAIMALYVLIIARCLREPEWQ